MKVGYRFEGKAMVFDSGERIEFPNEIAWTDGMPRTAISGRFLVLVLKFSGNPTSENVYCVNTETEKIQWQIAEFDHNVDRRYDQIGYRPYTSVEVTEEGNFEARNVDGTNYTLSPADGTLLTSSRYKD